MKTGEHDFLFLKDRITEEHKKYSIINFVIMFLCLFYFRVIMSPCLKSVLRLLGQVVGRIVGGASGRL